MPLGIQPIHIVIVIAVAFLIFGGSKLPEMGRSAGKAISEFRKGAKEITDGFHEEAGQTGGTQTPVPIIQSPQAPDLTTQIATVQDTAAAAQAAFVAPVGRFCTQCGAPNLSAARFCNSCGMKLPE
ncbi:MAG: twin-arginine translocase TatA/TatE family subunit [Anaerolineales bacterium]